MSRDRCFSPSRSRLDLPLIERAVELAARAGDHERMGRAIEALGLELADRDPVTRGMLDLDRQLRSAAALRLGTRERIAITSAAPASMRDLGSALQRVEPATTKHDSKLGRSHDLIGPERSEGPPLARRERNAGTDAPHAAHAGHVPANRGKNSDPVPSDRGDRGETRDDDQWGGRS